ncbi:TetR/AcrR family transcriptional regulator [Nonomuraea sp. NBC_01738]|uniref:TetR/AcrR family transcriptional regulator n=1 Tax=Nonomuraea sp. NBC_01738 TaxID=2976003 RepID=UPI002E1314B5|nr:TetR/AcrR family transcriptional regulator [Nonomuraea sp. NBC_01738]
MRLAREERREQILDAATRAFGRTGFADTSVDEVAAEAGITRVILYRHFDSKTTLYREVLDRASERLFEQVGAGGFGENTIASLLGAAAGDPDGFRLLFHHAAREPEFRDQMDKLTSTAIEVAEKALDGRVPPGPWANWAAKVTMTFTIEAVIAWLDAGRPSPDEAATRIRTAVRGIITASGPL